jgi:hypothetical protein
MTSSCPHPTAATASNVKISMNFFMVVLLAVVEVAKVVAGQAPVPGKV